MCIGNYQVPTLGLHPREPRPTRLSNPSRHPYLNVSNQRPTRGRNKRASHSDQIHGTVYM
ncbi:hypothetical protein FIBSPDRAFT_466758 [Athelia psychrophila]|uniref:Uncharacterized protein n=1 Tax=Athelia psychrophila TaxID=1759441 RepID=A0A166LL06_9AGAM|nr:hypothetical protein FIBSPDRAFT_466758 [Fibularhizoctonia sp. CBS 109695]